MARHQSQKWDANNPISLFRALLQHVESLQTSSTLRMRVCVVVFTHIFSLLWVHKTALGWNSPNLKSLNILTKPVAVPVRHHPSLLYTPFHLLLLLLLFFPSLPFPFRFLTLQHYGSSTHAFAYHISYTSILLTIHSTSSSSLVVPRPSLFHASYQRVRSIKDDKKKKKWSKG